MSKQKRHGLYFLAAVILFFFLVSSAGLHAFAKETQNYALTTITDQTVYTTPTSPKRLNVIIFGRPTCGNTKGIINSISVRDWVGASDVGFIYADIDGNDKATVTAFAQDKSSHITFCYGDNSSLMWTLGTASGSITLPVMVYIGQDGVVKETTTGYRTASEINSTISGILGDWSYAEQNITMHYTGRNLAEEARTEFEMINAFRTNASEAWYWNRTNTEKVYCSNLEPLVYDYELEKVAIKRAEELVAFYDHTRPNLEGYGSAYPKGAYGATAENIACGQASAENVFIAWREDADDYAGQGHRRNMLTTQCNAVGVACIEAEGKKFWVQEFGYKSSFSSENTTKINYTQDDYRCEVEVSPMFYDDSEIHNPDSLEVEYGKTTTEEAGAFFYASYDIQVYFPSTCQAANPVIVSETAGKLTGLQVGSTTVSVNSVTRPGRTEQSTVSVTVNPAAFRNVKLEDLAEEYPYTGKAVTPAFTLSYAGNQLTAGTDYEFDWEDNTLVGTAKLYLSGKGNFSGSRVVSVAIVPAVGWNRDATGWFYVSSDKTRSVSKWEKISGKYYYFNAKGYMQTGWLEEGGKWYYLLPGSGALATGWKQLGGKWYFFKSSGAMATGWQKIGGVWYFFQPSGAMTTKWKMINGKWYYFGTSGAMVSNTSMVIGKKRYNFNASGVCTNP